MLGRKLSPLFIQEGGSKQPFGNTQPILDQIWRMVSIYMHAYVCIPRYLSLGWRAKHGGKQGITRQSRTYYTVEILGRILRDSHSFHCRWKNIRIYTMIPILYLALYSIVSFYMAYVYMNMVACRCTVNTKEPI